MKKQRSNVRSKDQTALLEKSKDFFEKNLEIESHFKESMSKPHTEHHLPPRDFFGPATETEMQWEEINGASIAIAVSSKRPSAAPGADTISNAILKRCVALHPFLAQVFNGLLKFSVCLESWKQAITLLIHKGGPSRALENWRPIGLTSFLGKLFHSIISHRVLAHVTSSGVIDTTIQKGFLPRVNGTIEHTQSLCELLEFQRRHKRQYCLGQFGLKNAFGALPHSVLFDALQWARISPRIVAYIRALYDGAPLQVKCAEGLTNHIPVQRGVLQGDTLSPVLFLIAMEVVLRFLRSSFPKYEIVWNDSETFLKAFADDLTMLTNTPEEMQNATNVLVRVLSMMGVSKRQEVPPSAYGRKRWGL